jgi:hypothetical protein
MSLIIPNDWFVNEDKSIIFYDTIRHKDCCTNKSKKVIPTWAAASQTKEVKPVQMFEHRIAGQPSNFKISASQQFDGFQVYFKSKFSILLALSLGRRLREGKEYNQTPEEVEVLFGLREAPVVETTVETPVESTEVPVPIVELESIVVQ